MQKQKRVCPRVFIFYFFSLQAPRPSGEVANESVNVNKHKNNTRPWERPLKYARGGYL